MRKKFRSCVMEKYWRNVMLGAHNKHGGIKLLWGFLNYCWYLRKENFPSNNKEISRNTQNFQRLTRFEIVSPISYTL